MIGLKIAILLGFALMFAAGLAVGRGGRLEAVTPARPTTDTSYLAARLNLSADQQKQMEAIWSKALENAPDMPARIHDLETQRDSSVQQILSANQRASYDQLESQYDTQLTQLRATRDKIMHDAQDQTRTILTDRQRDLFDMIIKQTGHFSPSMKVQPATQP